MKETLVRIHEAMCGFKATEPIIVEYDKSTHILIYRQVHKIVRATNLTPYFLPKKRFKLGILTSSEYNYLMQGLGQLIQDPDLDKECGPISFSIDKLQLKVYKSYNDRRLPGPQLCFNFKFANITDPFFMWLMMKFYSLETKRIYKMLKSERKLNEKENKNNK